MTSEKTMLIYDLAASFKDALNIGHDSFEHDKFDIERTVSDVGGRIEYFSSGSSEEEVIKTEDGGFIIRIDESEAAARRRFSIARELGHLFMHMQYGSEEWERLEPGKYRKPPGMHTALEEEANAFSAAFLMPAKRFAEVAETTSDGRFFYPKEIAGYFDTYEDAVIFHGKNLSLWE